MKTISGLTLSVLLAISGNTHASCSARLDDTFNRTQYDLALEHLSDRSFVAAMNQEKVKVLIDESGVLRAPDISIPEIKMDDLIARYDTKNEPQLKFSFERSCTVSDQAILYYLVMEWFLFG